MPLDDIEIGRLLQKMDEMVSQLETLNARMTAWQPIIDEAQKQQTRSRSIHLSITVAAVVGFSLFFLTAATWYIRSGGAVPYNTVPVNTGR
jgi:hypothetical protein